MDRARFDYLSEFLRPIAIETPLIRVGSFGDGGYVVPNDFSGIAACYSPGVSQQSSFELDIAKYGIPSFMADASVDSPSINVPRSQFLKKFIGAEDKGNVISMARWVAETDTSPDDDLLLQMDIEGAEYAALSAMPDNLVKRFRMIILELHHLPAVLTKEPFFRRAKAAIDRLNPWFQSVHLHPNNASGSVTLEGIDIPRVVEISLLRRDRVKRKEALPVLPHPLDVPHRANRPPIKLPPAWGGIES